jgi:hypothetical protein
MRGLERFGRRCKSLCGWELVSSRDAVAVVPIGHGTAALLAPPTPFIVFVLQDIE